MKKVLVAIMLVIAVVFSFAISASAATEEEVLAEFSTIPSSKYVMKEVKQLLDLRELTSEQCDKILVLIAKVKAALPTDKGPAAGDYTEAEVESVMTVLDEGCDMLNFSYDVKYLKSAGPSEKDFSLVLYDNETSKTAFRYNDGKISLGGINSNTDSMTFVLLAAGVAVLACATTVVFVKVKKSKVTE